jgi:thiosulfate/3-mercaptopyruvate sulfurtransferase
MRRFQYLLLVALLGTLTFGSELTQAQKTSENPTGWSTLISAKTLHDRLEHTNLLVIDARSAKEYATGHVPGAINLPGTYWRTPVAAPGEIGQKIFRDADGNLDVKRYEDFLSKAGVKPEDEIVVYGNHAGKADGSIPAAILLKLGHANVSFLDGIGLDEWQAAGYPITDLPPSPQNDG